MKNWENNGMEEIGLVTPTPVLAPVMTGPYCIMTNSYKTVIMVHKMFRHPIVAFIGWIDISLSP